MKNLLSFLIAMSVGLSIAFLQAHEQTINQKEKTIVVANNSDNSKQQAAKKHSDKAWRGVDRLLTKIMVASVIVGTIGYAIPPVKRPCSLDCQYINENEIKYIDNKPEYKRTIIRPHFIQSCFTLTALATLAKVGVKFKRAYDHGKNIISFVIADAFADIK
jgi:hypothetical protein